MSARLTGGKRQRGAELVEFAITLPFILLIVFILIEFAVVLNNQAVLTDASRAAAIAAIKGEDGTLAARQVFSSRIPWVEGAPPSVGISRDASCGAPPDPGCEIEVTVTQAFTFKLIPDFVAGFPLLQDFSAPSIQVSGQTIMYEQKY